MDLAPIDQSPRANCWQISLDRGESLIGTASRVDVWFLLTYDGPMGAKAFAESTIPGEVKDYFNELLGLIPHSRLLLMKSHPQMKSHHLSVVVGREMDPFTMRFELDRYEDAMGLDLADALVDESIHAEKIHRQPFFTVCTNGNRDPCCARNGLRTFRALREIAHQRVWQSSHVGGHRFAANVLAFPHGIYFGRVEPEDVDSLVDAGDRGEIQLENYRGRACFDPVVQAADLVLRQNTDRMELTAYRLVDATQGDADAWVVRFAGVEDGVVHAITLKAHDSEDQAYVSCRSDKKKPMVTYELTSYRTEARSSSPSP